MKTVEPLKDLHKVQIPYGLWKRTAPRAHLDPPERDERDYAELWDLRNDAQAELLDSYLGRRVLLVEERRSVLDDVYPAGMSFTITGRTEDKLLGEAVIDEDGIEVELVLLLKVDWIAIAMEDSDAE
jgi:hypothetical protein